ncbi:MAG: 2-oxoacid:acceptor oxidoreductase family protein [Polyangiaceae bacterium]
MGSLTVCWFGRGGQGCFTAARVLGLAATRQGLHALAFPTFGPERRGAPISGFTRINDLPIRDRSEITHPDVVILLDHSLEVLANSRGGRDARWLLVNRPGPISKQEKNGRLRVELDASGLAERRIGRRIANTAMLGALSAATHRIELGALQWALERELKVAHRTSNLDVLGAAFEEVSRG